MIAYVATDSVKVGDIVNLELRNSKGDCLAVVQSSKVVRVQPSPHHDAVWELDEIEF